LKGKSQKDIYCYLFAAFGYLLDFYTFEQLKQTNETGSSAFNTVPISIWIAFNSTSFEDCLRLVLYCQGGEGADTDSIMSMAASVAYAYHFRGNEKSVNTNKDFRHLEFETKKYLFKNNQNILQIVQEFEMQKNILGIPF
jgi:ADP-ribosylglycohydrolase